MEGKGGSKDNVASGWSGTRSSRILRIVGQVTAISTVLFFSIGEEKCKSNLSSNISVPFFEQIFFIVERNDEQLTWTEFIFKGTKKCVFL